MLACPLLGWHQPEIGHQLARIGKAREVAQFGNQPQCRRRCLSGHEMMAASRYMPPVRHSGTDGLQTCMGVFLSSGFLFVAGSLFGAERPFLVPSPAIRFAERAEGVKGPKC